MPARKHGRVTCGQEVRDVAQCIAERAVQVRAVVEGVHLVDPDAREVGGVPLDGVEQRDRLAVGERDDDVGAAPMCSSTAVAAAAATS